MRAKESGVLQNSDFYFSVPSPIAKRLYFYPLSVGHFFCDQNYLVSRQNYDSYLIMYIIKGNFKFFSEQKEFSAQKGDTVLLNCYKQHSYSANDDSECIWMHFDGQNSFDFYQEITKTSNVIRCNDAQNVEKLLFGLYEQLSKKECGLELEYSLDIYKILAELSKPLRISSINNATYEQTVNMAKKYIVEHLSEQIKVGDIAKTVHMSLSHFSRIFKQQTGFSPYDYLLVTRLNQAKDYLQKTDMPIMNIAMQTGFNSDANFIYFFTLQTGISPGKFRKLKF